MMYSFFTPVSISSRLAATVQSFRSAHQYMHQEFVQSFATVFGAGLTGARSARHGAAAHRTDGHGE